MNAQIKTAEFERRFSCASDQKNDKPKTSSADIAQQIAEFQRKGGAIKEIPQGVGNLGAGIVIVGEAPESMGTPRPAKSARKTRANTADESPFINLKDAAKALGITPSSITRKIQKGDLALAAVNSATGEKLVRRDSVNALKNKMNGKKS